MKIHHFAIKVKNIDKSIAFYIEKLDFKIKIPKTKSNDGLYTYANLDLGGGELELIQIHSEDKVQIENNIDKTSLCPHIGLETYNFDADLELLRKRGVEIFIGPHVIPNDVKILTILDPDGYRIDIGQLLK